MSIKPIDLQTLFVKMDEVSKQQSQIKGQSSLQQSNAARAQIAKELEQDHKVTEVPEENELSNVKDREERRGNENKKQKKPENKEEPEEPEVLRDPDIGQHIDISG